MYFEHSHSMYFDSVEDENIEVQGVHPHHMASLMRNLVCCVDSELELHKLKGHNGAIQSLAECKDKLNEWFDNYEN